MAKKTEGTNDKAKATQAKAAKATAAAAPAKKAPAKAKAAKADHKHTTASPHRTVAEKHGGKEKLAKSLAELVAAADEDTDTVASRLQSASNKQLLRLHAVTETVKRKFGSRDKLIAKLAGAQAKDKDYVAKLGTYSLPHLLDLARGAQ